MSLPSWGPMRCANRTAKASLPMPVTLSRVASPGSANGEHRSGPIAFDPAAFEVPVSRVRCCARFASTDALAVPPRLGRGFVRDTA
jgi:hypothetical protein